MRNFILITFIIFLIFLGSLSIGKKALGASVKLTEKAAKVMDKVEKKEKLSQKELKEAIRIMNMKRPKDRFIYFGTQTNLFNLVK